MYKTNKQYYDKDSKLHSNIINMDQNIQTIATKIKRDITLLNLTIDDLKVQIEYCHNKDNIKTNNDVNLITTTIDQDTDIKLVYLQYLLLYDINLTNGIFIDEYLEKAQHVLDCNDGKLKHIKDKII